MKTVQAHRLGLLLAGATAASLLLLLLQGFRLPWPDETSVPLTPSIVDNSDLRMICSSEQPYDIALCLPDSTASRMLPPPPLAEMPCRREGDLVVHGGNACLTFDDLHSRPYEFLSRLTTARSAFLLYPQDLPARELVRRAKLGLLIGVKPINNPKLSVLNTSKSVCTEDQRDTEVYRFVVIVKSATQNFRARNRLREFMHKQISKLPFPVGLIFSMGLPREAHEMASNEPILQQLKTEIDRFDDVLLTNFVDTYENLTLKTLINLRFAHILCRGVSPQFVFLDDDYGLRLDGLLDALAGFSRLNLFRHAFGIVNPSSPVIRIRGHKWALDQDDFPYVSLPTYMSGFFYVIGAQAVEALSIVAAFTKPLRLEDVYVGILATKLNISLHTLSGIFLRWPPASAITSMVVAPIEYFAENAL